MQKVHLLCIQYASLNGEKEISERPQGRKMILRKVCRLKNRNSGIVKRTFLDELSSKYAENYSLPTLFIYQSKKILALKY